MRTTAAIATNSACGVCLPLTAATTATTAMATATGSASGTAIATAATAQVVCSRRFVAVILDACGGA